MTGKKSYERNSRLILKQFDIAAQQKLSDARVLVIGAGGLGCACLQFLAAAGTGHQGIVDDDTIMLHNLHRQVLYSTSDVGKQKATVAKEKLLALNPEINITTYTERITNKNALDIIASYKIVIDGTDNFTCYTINDACVLLNKPLLYGGLSPQDVTPKPLHLY